MHIAKLDTYNDEKELTYTVRFSKSDAPPNFEGTMDALMDAIEFHHQKAKDYDGAESEFGMKGEIIGITRKVRKLKQILWDGKDPIFEGAQEMLMDLIGNSLLTLRMQKLVSDKYSASWRDNHHSKPTFGPGPKGHPGDRAEMQAVSPIAKGLLERGAVQVSHPEPRPAVRMRDMERPYVPRGFSPERIEDVDTTHKM